MTAPTSLDPTIVAQLPPPFQGQTWDEWPPAIQAKYEALAERKA